MDAIWVGCNGKKNIKVPTGPVYEILRQLLPPFPVRCKIASQLLVKY